MFTFHGGQSVEKGTYWDLSNGERIDAAGTTALPGTKSEHYVKLPVAGVLIAGPLAGLLFTIVIPFLFLLVTLLFLPRTILSSEAVASDEAKACRGCHATPGMSKSFKDKSTVDLSPWRSPYVEGIIGSIRRECLDHVVVVNEASLRRRIASYLDKYQESRCPLSLEKNSPDGRAVEPTELGRIVAIRRSWAFIIDTSAELPELASAGSLEGLRRRETDCSPNECLGHVRRCLRHGARSRRAPFPPRRRATPIVDVRRTAQDSCSRPPR